MGRTLESFQNGLVTSRDISLLGEGELARCDECTYLPNDLSLHTARGRSRFENAALNGAVKGLAYCGFDSTYDRVLAATATRLYISNTGQTGTFSTLVTQNSNVHLQAIHYNDRHYLIDGQNRIVLLSDGTIRQHGMLPVTNAPSLKETATDGTWPTDIAPIGKYYQYWVTEVYKSGDEFVESTFEGTPAVVLVTTAASHVLVSRPAAKENSGTTHWRVYRSTAMESAKLNLFPTGYLISSDIPWDTLSLDDGVTATTGAVTKLPTTTELMTIGVGSLGVTYVAWTNPNNLTATDGVYATAPAATIRGSSCKGFDLSSVVGSLSDITVDSLLSVSSGTASVTFKLSWDGGVSWTGGQTVLVSSATPARFSVGGSWGHQWNPAELSSANFRVGIIGIPEVGTLSADDVRVTVAYTGSVATIITPFPAINIADPTSPTGETVGFGRNNHPTTATTGDIFQGSLVLNDPDEPGSLVYSTAGNPDYFCPDAYRLRFPTPTKDIVKNFKSLGTVGIAGLLNYIFRVMYLPRETDPEFETDRAVEMIDSDGGIVGPMAACRFAPDNGPLTLFFISRYGPRLTNAYTCTTATDDLDWEALVSVPFLENCVVVNNQRMQKITLFYTPKGGATNSKALDFHYHPRHLKNGKMKVSGPYTVNATAACQVRQTDGGMDVFTGQTDGFVYVESTGSTDASGNAQAPSISTREIAPAGPGADWKIDQLRIHHQSNPGSQMRVTFTTTKTNTNPVTTPQAQVVETVRRGFTRVTPIIAGEGVQMHIALDPETDATLDYTVFDHDVESQVEHSLK